MSAQRNWNDMSSDEDEDSWFDSAEDPKEKREETVENTATQPVQPATLPAPPPPTQEQKQPQQEEKEVKEKREARQEPKKEGAGERKSTHLTDEELLQEYTKKTVDDPRIIKAVRVANEEHKELLKAIKNARVREVREGIFILNFDSPDELLNFIREKIANRYRFFLQPFYKRKEEPREERRPRNEDRRERERKPKYQDDREEDERRGRKEEGKKERERAKEPREEEKVKKPKESAYEIESNKNILVIKSEGFDVDRLIQELEEKRIFKDFNKLRIRTPFALASRVAKLVSQIGSKFKFNLDKEPPADAKKEDVIELTLVENLPLKTTKAFAEKYEEKPEKPKPKETRPQPAKPEQGRTEQVVHARRLGGNFEEYFSEVGIYNLSEIVRGFDENEYVRRLKENSAAIFEKNWNSWKIEAEDEAIEALLKLTHRLKKSTLYDVELRPSMRAQRPLLTAELRPRPEKDRRPKVDVSGVNGYLS